MFCDADAPSAPPSPPGSLWGTQEEACCQWGGPSPPASPGSAAAAAHTGWPSTAQPSSPGWSRPPSACGPRFLPRARSATPSPLSPGWASPSSSRPPSAGPLPVSPGRCYPALYTHPSEERLPLGPWGSPPASADAALLPLGDRPCSPYALDPPELAGEPGGPDPSATTWAQGSCPFAGAGCGANLHRVHWGSPCQLSPAGLAPAQPRLQRHAACPATPFYPRAQLYTVRAEGGAGPGGAEPCLGPCGAAETENQAAAASGWRSQVAGAAAAYGCGSPGAEQTQPPAPAGACQPARGQLAAGARLERTLSPESLAMRELFLWSAQAAQRQRGAGGASRAAAGAEQRLAGTPQWGASYGYDSDWGHPQQGGKVWDGAPRPGSCPPPGAASRYGLGDCSYVEPSEADVFRERWEGPAGQQGTASGAVAAGAPGPLSLGGSDWGSLKTLLSNLRRSAKDTPVELGGGPTAPQLAHCETPGSAAVVRQAYGSAGRSAKRAAGGGGRCSPGRRAGNWSLRALLSPRRRRGAAAALSIEVPGGAAGDGGDSGDSGAGTFSPLGECLWAACVGCWHELHCESEVPCHF